MKHRFHTALEATFGIALISLALQAGATPVITSAPKALIVNAGSTASFSVSATGAEPLSYQWMFKGTNLDAGTNATLVLENVATNQAGAYSVKVTDATGHKVTPPVALTVQQGTIVRFALATGNVDVELFDHDKPITVQNFLHYFQTGLYTNTFFHRLKPGFVIQGGGYSTFNRSTEDFVPTNSWAIYETASTTVRYAPIVDEFQRGPRVGNVAGTLAMARTSSNGTTDPNSATSQWFFNLADNTSLDNVSGGFTVFGRVIRGWDVLSAFNNFSTNNGITNLSTAWPTNGGTAFPTLPYQSNGGSDLRNSDLFYANMSLLTKVAAIADKTPPAMRVTYPAFNSRMTNGMFTLHGTASDGVGVSRVDLWLYYQAPDGHWYGAPAPVEGTTNWSASTVEAAIQIGEYLNLPFPQTNLYPGPYVALLRAWDGSGNVTFYQSAFFVDTPVHITTIGQGSVTPNLDGKYCDTAPSTYTLRALPKPGWLFYLWTAENGNTARANPFTLSMWQGINLTATFLPNYFPIVAGRYDGLFCQSSNAAPGTAGYISVLPKTSGAYSGYLLLGNLRGNFSGQFDAAGNSQITVKFPNSTNKVNLALSMDLTNNTGTISGTVRDTNAPWSSDIVAYRSVTKLTTNSIPAPGKYVLRLPADPALPNQPAGDGYVTVTVGPTGLLTVAGTLPDGSVISESVTVSKDGKWPLFASLNNGKGLLYGWETFSTNCAGPLQWVHPDNTNTFYTNGFSATINSVGDRYAAPVRTNSYQIVFSGGALETPFASPLTATATGVFTVPAKPANGLKLTMTAAGSFTGSFTNAFGTKPLTFKGAFENADEGGFGYFVTPSGQAGQVELTPATP